MKCTLVKYPFSSFFKSIFWCAMILSHSILLGEVNFHDWDSYQGTVKQSEIEAIIQTYLKKQDQITEFYRFDSTRNVFEIGDLSKGQIDYTLLLKRESVQENKTKSHEKTVMRKKSPFEGVKIAIDPGHFGTPYAYLEERFISIPAGTIGNPDPIEFNEGTLTYLTALELCSLLEKKGAKVMITKKGIGQGAIKESFFQWLEKEPLLWNPQAKLSSLFRGHYNQADLRLRADEINQFKPDLTVIIHYNSEGEKEGHEVTEIDYVIGFMPGAFCSGELETPESRYEFLRLILTNDLQKSLKLNRKVIQRLSQTLSIPTSDDIKSLEKVCLSMGGGVFARNLSLTRRIHSPVVYVEALIQNNREELKKLSHLDTTIEGIPASERLKQVSRACFNGIKDYLLSDE